MIKNKRAVIRKENTKKEKGQKNVPRMVKDSSPKGYNIYYIINYLNFSIYCYNAEDAVVSRMVMGLPYKQCPSPEGTLGSITSHSASAPLNLIK